MSDLLTRARAVAAVKFKWQKDEKTYDYFAPEGMALKPGDKVIVETRRGETEVEVIAIKADSDMAEKAILRISEPAQPATDQPKTDWNF